MNGNSLPAGADKVFTSVNKSLMDGDIVNRTLSAVQNMAGNPAQHSSTGISFQEQSDFLKNWYSLDCGNIANFKA